MKKKIFFVAAVMISSRLMAQPLQDTTGKVLDEVIHTASKFDQKQSTTGKVVTVISKEQLLKSSGKTVAQVLNEQPGITIAGAYNPTGSVQTVFMRGASSGRALILVDGIPVSDPSMINSEFDLNLFSINDVERIEICRGAQSTLYGSDAIAGVINIITIKKDIRKPFNLSATTGFGNENTVRNNLQVYGRVGKLTYTSRFAKLSTDGFSAAHDNTGTKHFDKDGYNGNVINASMQYQATQELSFKTFIQHSQYKAAIDAGAFADEKDYNIRNGELSSGVGFGYKKGKLNITGNYQYAELTRKYKNDSLDVPGFTKFEDNRYGGRTQYAELYGSDKLNEWLTLLAGFDYRWGNMHQQYFSISSFGPYSSSFPDSSTHQTSYYGSLFFSALQKRLNLELGARANNHSRYGKNNTYTINPSFAIDKNWRLFGSVATGFKAPSIFQVYDVYSGNPDLKPEKSTNYEGGIQFQDDQLSGRVVYFHRIIKNGIDYNYNTFKYFNFVKQTVNGWEFEVTAHPVQQLTISANYTMLSGNEQTESRVNFHDTTYNYLLRRPKNDFNLTIGYQFCPSFYASINGKSVSQRYDAGDYQSPDVLLSGYFLLNAYAEYKWKEHVKFFIDGKNLTNKKFYDIRGYNSIPVLVNGGITVTF